MNSVWKTVLAGAAISTIIMASSTAEAAPYTVQKGDTLTKIAKAHNTTILQLKRWNNLPGDQIYIMQKLVVASKAAIPAISVVEETKTVTHTVAKGDNLTKIAKKYSMSVANLKKVNKLKSDVIKIGQKLTIIQSDKVASIKPTTPSKDMSVEAQVATQVEAVIEFKETADQVIEKQLADEKELTAMISKEAEASYAQAIEIAKQAIGIPYKFGGTTLDGFDCSGFVNYVYNSVGFDMARKSSLMYFEQDTTKVKEPVPGDLVFFKNTFIPTISHMGIYIGNDEFIHAGSKGVTIANINEKYWAERYVAFKRLNTVK